ncbi:MAG TPA: transporter, partial [Myxococcales bacterium]|nr:transporter [Myxococcales bacterium]
MLLLFALPITAEEGGSGHYVPGTTASFIDAFSGRPGLTVANFFYYYGASATFRLPVAELVTTTLDATIYADSLVATYQTRCEVLGGRYAFGAILPVLWMNMSATAIAGSGSQTKGEITSGIGDLLLYPFLLGWTAAEGQLKYDLRVGVYAPTGVYEVGSIANLGKNYWTFEPAVAVSYVSREIGVEASGFAGVDLNTKNTATDYLTGTQVHIDATIAQHFPLWGGSIGVGTNVFYYQQIAGDSGSGAVLGDFKGHSFGAGPVASFAMKISGVDGAIEVKWLPELEVKNRLEGNYFWVKIRAVF